MKSLLCIVLIVLGSSLAQESMVYSQPYSCETIREGYHVYSENSSWLCDNFVLGEPVILSSISFWTAQYEPFVGSINLIILVDNTQSGNPNFCDLFWEGEIQFKEEFTGTYWMGIKVYNLRCVIPEGIRPNLVENIHYYIGVQFKKFNINYILTSDNLVGGTCWYTSNENEWVETCEIPHWFSTDLFIELYSENLALQSTTWANIKCSW